MNFENSKTKEKMDSEWVLITGASSGIGEATARELAKQNYNLILTARRKDRLEALKEEILVQKRKQMESTQAQEPSSSQNPAQAQAQQPSQRQIQIEISSFDIQKPLEVANFFKEHESLIKKVNVLINNAGLALKADKLYEASMLDLNTMIDTNIKGLLMMTQGVLPSMLERKTGHIVNIGSIAGRWIYPGGAVYCATKFAVRALTEGLRADLLGKNIRVTNVAPGMANTEFSLVRYGSKEKADAVYQGMQALTGQDVAETISWVLSRPKHVNIQEIVVYPTDQASPTMVHRENQN